MLLSDQAVLALDVGPHKKRKVMQRLDRTYHMNSNSELDALEQDKDVLGARHSVRWQKTHHPAYLNVCDFKARCKLMQTYKRCSPDVGARSTQDPAQLLPLGDANSGRL